MPNMNDLISVAASSFGPFIDPAEAEGGAFSCTKLERADKRCLNSMRWRASALVAAGLLPEGRRGRNGGPAEITPEDAALFLISTAISLSGGLDIHSGVRHVARLMTGATKLKIAGGLPAAKPLIETFHGALAYFLKTEPFALRWVRIEIDRPRASICAALSEGGPNEQLAFLSYEPQECSFLPPVVREVEIPQHTLVWFSANFFGEPAEGQA